MVDCWLARSDKIVVDFMLDTLTRVEVRDDPHEVCPICLEKFRGPQLAVPKTFPGKLFRVGGPQTITTLPCRHIFHRDCIKKWFRDQLRKRHADLEKITCPVCRGPVYSPFVKSIEKGTGNQIASMRRSMLEILEKEILLKILKNLELS